MATRLEPSDDSEVEQILLRALRKQGQGDESLRERLLNSADELGIPRAAVLQAEKEHLAEMAQERDLAEFHADQRKNLRQHLLIFAIVNVCVGGINFMTWSLGHTLWVLYLTLSWGIAIGIHATVVSARRGGDSLDYKMWRRTRGKDKGAE